MKQDTMVQLYFAYRLPGRFFHNLEHIAICFQELTEAIKSGVVINNEAAVRFALWFHDYVYDGTRTDNEELSAEAAYKAAIEEGYDEAFASLVKRLVLVTKHTPEYVPVTPDEQLIVDIDLSASLAARDFTAVSAEIRKEYAHVPDEVFEAKRKEILRAFIENKDGTERRIYHTHHFYVKHETRSRANIFNASKSIVNYTTK